MVVLSTLRCPSRFPRRDGAAARRSRRQGFGETRGALCNGASDKLKAVEAESNDAEIVAIRRNLDDLKRTGENRASRSVTKVKRVMN